MRRVEFEFDLLPECSAMDIFRRFEPDVRDVLNDQSEFVELNDRADSSLYFFCKLESKISARYNSAYLRAGLNEYYALEDAAKRDCQNMDVSMNPPRIRDSRNPLIHLMYLLRHVNVHAAISDVTSHETTVISKIGGDEKEIDWESVVLTKPTLDQVMRCNEAHKYYEREQLVKATQWLDQEQLSFGAGVLFSRGISSYCREVLVSVGKLQSA